MPKDGILPQFPGGAEYLWDWWCEISGMNGQDFSASSVQAWFSLMGISPEPFEVEAVCAIQKALIKVRSES